MYIPTIKSIDTALQIYYTYSEIGTKEIEILFEKTSKSSITKLKKLAREKMINENISSHSLYKVNTNVAFSAWGINIDDLEFRKKKLHELKLNA